MKKPKEPKLSRFSKAVQDAYGRWSKACQDMALTLSATKMCGGEAEAPDAEGHLWRFYFLPDDEMPHTVDDLLRHCINGLVAGDDVTAERQRLTDLLACWPSLVVLVQDALDRVQPKDRT
jgi:hypothetical protein